MPTFRDLTGQTFNRLTVLRYSGKDQKGRHYWDCQCVCGIHRRVRGSHLTRGETKSCGCFSKDIAPQRNFQHGQCRTPEYNIYHGIIQRCTNPKAPGYPNYGGRGIRVEWLTFEAFFADMSNRPGPDYSVDRIDNNGPYSKENCRWATARQQSNNARRNVRFTFAGKTQTQAQWAREIGIEETTLSERLKRGWSLEKALTEPVNVKHRRVS